MPSACPSPTIQEAEQKCTVLSLARPGWSLPFQPPGTCVFWASTWLTGRASGIWICMSCGQRCGSLQATALTIPFSQLGLWPLGSCLQECLLLDCRSIRAPRSQEKTQVLVPQRHLYTNVLVKLPTWVSREPKRSEGAWLLHPAQQICIVPSSRRVL